MFASDIINAYEAGKVKWQEKRGALLGLPSYSPLAKVAPTEHVNELPASSAHVVEDGFDQLQLAVISSIKNADPWLAERGEGFIEGFVAEYHTVHTFPTADASFIKKMEWVHRVTAAALSALRKELGDAGTGDLDGENRARPVHERAGALHATPAAFEGVFFESVCHGLVHVLSWYRRL